MTEEEAKTKWCPFVRAWEGAGNSWCTRPVSGPDDTGLMTPDKTTCIGSACMAWRESEEAVSAMFIGGKELPARPAKGYCGLAGTPA